MKLVYLAPSDIQIARVDRQCIVSFCEAVRRQGVDVELVAMRIRLLDVEPEAKDPLAPYRIRDRFPVRLTRAPVHQESAGWWIALNRLWVHLVAALSSLRERAGSGALVFYEKNYGPALALLAVKGLSTPRPLLAFEAHLPPRNVLQRFVLRHVDRVLANTHALAADLAAGGAVDGNRVIGTHQGVDLELVDAGGISKAEARSRLRLPRDEKLVVYTGKIYWGYQEVEYILEAAARLRARGDTRFLLVGGRADHVARFRAEVVERRLGNVSFPGFVPPREVHLYQKAADALLLYYPSGIELNRYRSPGKLFEYMAAGNPIVACDLPVIREVLGEEPAAALVPQDSPAALAAAIEDILGDAAKASRLAAAARERVESFTWEARARSVLEFLDASRA